MRRVIPQWLVRLVCGWRGHPRKYKALYHLPSAALNVESCPCGENQMVQRYTAQYPVPR